MGSVRPGRCDQLFASDDASAFPIRCVCGSGAGIHDFRICSAETTIVSADSAGHLPHPGCFGVKSAQSLEKKRVEFCVVPKSAQEFEKKELECSGGGGGGGARPGGPDPPPPPLFLKNVGGWVLRVGAGKVFNTKNLE